MSTEEVEDKHVYIDGRLEVDSRCWNMDIPKHHGDWSPKKMIDDYLFSLMGKERRTGGWIHPSGIGFCFRGMFYDKQDIAGEELSRPENRKLMGVGTAIHEMYQKWMQEAVGEVDKDVYEDELPARYRGFQVSGRIDGVFKLYDWVWEIKTVSEKAYARLSKPREKDLYQLHIYMWIMDIPRGVLHYINRNTGEDMEFRILFDRKIWTQVDRMLMSIQWHERNGSVPVRADSKFFCRTCKYYTHCMKDEEGINAPETAFG